MLGFIVLLALSFRQISLLELLFYAQICRFHKWLVVLLFFPLIESCNPEVNFIHITCESRKIKIFKKEINVYMQ